MLENKEGLMSTTESSRDVVVIHPLDPEDASTIGQIEAAVRPYKGLPWRIEEREQYDALLEGVRDGAR